MPAPRSNARETPAHEQPCVSSHTHNASQQTTLKNPIYCRGIGLHSGAPALLRLLPATADTGITFQRTDIKNSKPFRITPESITPSPLATVATSPIDPSVYVATIEHLMAALHAAEIDNLLIQLDGAELPILDGCSQDFSFLLQATGRTTLSAPRREIILRKPVRVERENGSFAYITPFNPQAEHSHQLRLFVTIDFPAPAIGRQSYDFTLSPDTFRKEIAFCRTFVNYSDIATLQSQGLARGGSLQNALVIDHDHVLNPGGMRCDNECVRHKILDSIGDLYCSGYRIIGQFTGYKTGHALNNQLLRKIFADPNNWSFTSNTAALA